MEECQNHRSKLCWNRKREEDPIIAHFFVQVHPRSTGSKGVNWKQARALPMSGVIALCRNGVPVRMGTIVIWEHDKKGEWLDDPGGPQLGVNFETVDGFNESLQELNNNLFSNARITNLNKTLRNLKSEKVKNLNDTDDI